MTSVKQKIAAIERKKGEINAGVRKMGIAIGKLCSDIKEQARINATAIQEMSSGIRKIQIAIKEQAKINAAAVHKMGIGIKHIEEGIAKVVSKNRSFAGELKPYIKDFYFGEGKQ